MAKKTVNATDPEEAVSKGRQLVAEMKKEWLPKVKGFAFYGKKVEKCGVGKWMLGQDRETQAVMVRVLLDELEVLDKKVAEFRSALSEADAINPHFQPGWADIWNPRWVLSETLRVLLRRQLPLDDATAARLLAWAARADYQSSLAVSFPLAGIASVAESYASANELPEPVARAAEALVRRLRLDPLDKECRKTANCLQALLSGGPQVQIQPGEAWSDAALADLQQMKAGPSRAWNALLIHCQAGGAGKLTESWKRETGPLVEAVGFDALKDHVLRWFPLVDKPRTQPRVRQHRWEQDYNNLIIDPHVELLRGLVWCCGLREDADLARAIARLAVSAYKKIPGKGPRLVSLGNACVTSLGMMPGRAPIGQLAVLKVKIKFGTAQKEVEKAFNAAAAREGLPRDEIEELAVPSYGLEEVGLLRQDFGDYRAELLVDGSVASLHWSKDDKPLKSAPATVKKDFPEDFKELQGSLKDVNAMLPAQRERLDAMFLAQKTWPLSIWRERYLDHPLLGTIARRLIWTFTAKGEAQHGLWHGDDLVGVNGKPLKVVDTAEVSLWHPIGHPTEDVLAWRDFLMKREVVQPFKQAHREVYILTDAERRTRTYSNRFAAHVLKQHQFHALCAARGWKNKLRLMVDDSYTAPHRPLPQWNLRAEYWVEGAGTEYGSDTNESGVFLYLATDQVRFYPIDARQLFAHATGGGYERYGRETEEPLPLDEVPPLVFSEVMRDVDLFVGVASVGNDPNWADGGPDGRHLDYWQSYSFGGLSATAQTRKELLERLVPRLKIADRCSLTDRFLVVKGQLRTYKIHLGSGNILMEPNDQYLCIVPKQSVAGAERVFLPFEGDGTLSVILSKAFLLAADEKITDPTITSQLGR